MLPFTSVFSVFVYVINIFCFYEFWKGLNNHTLVIPNARG